MFYLCRHDSHINLVQAVTGQLHFTYILFLSQIVLLCKDPNGEGIDETLSNPRQSHNSISLTKAAELEGKITSLEEKLEERDKTINEMKLEIEATRKVIHNQND